MKLDVGTISPCPPFSFCSKKKISWNDSQRIFLRSMINKFLLEKISICSLNKIDLLTWKWRNAEISRCLTVAQLTRRRNWFPSSIAFVDERRSYLLSLLTANLEVSLRILARTDRKPDGFPARNWCSSTPPNDARFFTCAVDEVRIEWRNDISEERRCKNDDERWRAGCDTSDEEEKFHRVTIFSCHHR